MLIRSISLYCLVVGSVETVRTNPEKTVLQWDHQVNPLYPSCISSYSIEWNGGSYNTSDSTTSVSRDQLTGFPFCQNTLVTVTPHTRVRPLTELSNSSVVNLIDPGNEFIVGLGESHCTNLSMAPTNFNL